MEEYLVKTDEQVEAERQAAEAWHDEQDAKRKRWARETPAEREESEERDEAIEAARVEQEREAFKRKQEEERIWDPYADVC